MKKILKDASIPALAVAFLLVVGHWVVGGLNAFLSDSVTLTDVTESLLLSTAFWPSLIFVTGLISGGLEGWQDKQRMNQY